MIYYIAKCITLFAVFVVCRGGGNISECDSWNNLKTLLENRFKNLIKCTARSDCEGIDCMGKYNKYNFNVAAEIDPCKQPAVIDMVIDVPNSAIRNVTHTLRDGDQYKLPDFIPQGLFVDVSLKEKPGRKLNVEIKINVNNKSKAIPILTNCTIVRGQCTSTKGILKPIDHQHQHAHSTVMPTPQIITTKTCGYCNDTEECVQIDNGDSVCECKKGYTRDEFHICNEVMFNKTGKPCDMNKPFKNGCDENEICVEDYLHSPNGTCHCIDDYHPNAQDHCVKSDPTPERESNVSLILAIVLPICFLILFIACVFVMVRQKLFQRLRDRFRNVTRYEIVSIGNDDDEDDDEPLVVS